MHTSMKNHLRITIPKTAAGTRLSDYLVQNGYRLQAPCGGRGTCGKCHVTVISGSVSADASRYVPPQKTETPDAETYPGAYDVRSCRVFCTAEGSEILLPVHEGNGLTAFASSAPTPESSVTEQTDSAPATGIALDIGTTTLAAALIDLQTGTIMQTVSCLNPQQSFGADVMSRIHSVMQNKDTLAAMQQLLLDAVRDMIGQLSSSVPQTPPSVMSVAGNTTMLHLFCGISPVSMGTYPFTPVFTEETVYDGAVFGLPLKTVIVLPSASAFIGGDITAGICMSRLMEHASPAVLIDIGTNGEMVLYTGNNGSRRLYAASAAAGPAMEGAGISTGVGGIPGAVCSVSRIAGNRLVTRTIGSASPIGICGSGLIDLIACLLDMGVIDETGYMEDDTYTYAEQDNASLSVTQEDIRAFQLAKGAIRAGLTALCDAADISVSSLDCIYIAGGLGYYMNIDSAIRVGLLPDPHKHSDCHTRIKS
ncbi:MAG: ASKHA domain-containing protein, partial [Eubacteriales bacterium]